MAKLIALFKENKHLPKILFLLFIGLVLIVISGRVGSTPAEDSKELTLEEYKVQLEKEVAKLCSDVDGVGKCRVFITFERGEQNTYKGSLLIESKPPKVLGVTVICEGAEYDSVRRELSEMLRALFDIGANRVAVLKLN